MKILNFGSLNIDNVYAVENFVRPGETISSLKLEKFCGGKGLNQSIAVARAGATVYHAGAVGADGDILLDTLKEAGVNIDNVAKLDCPSGHAIIQVTKKGQNCIILFGGSNMEITKEMVREVLDQFVEGDLVILQNEISNMDYIIEYAYDRGIQVVLNPSPMNDNILNCPLDKVKWFFINEVEGKDISGKTDADDIIEEMKKMYPEAKIVLTLGKDGVKYYDGSAVYHHGIYDVPVVDTTAAGDTFSGYFIACIAEGLDPETVLEKASKASSLAVNKSGASVSIPARSEVESTDIVLEDRFLK